MLVNTAFSTAVDVPKKLHAAENVNGDDLELASHPIWLRYCKVVRY